jgi:hypothetical protein
MAREKLDPAAIIENLAEDAVYESQSAFEPIVGKSEIEKYLKERFRYIRQQAGKGRGRFSLSALFKSRKNEDSQQQDTGRLLPGFVNLPEAQAYPCLIFVADSKRQAVWVIRLNGSRKIQKILITTVAPHPSEAVLEEDARHAGDAW